MEKYASIETIWKRDPESHALALGKLRLPWADTIKTWSVTEKIDGMNIRAIWRYVGDTMMLEVRGRTDAAVLPGGLADAVELSFPNPRVIYEIWQKDLDAGRPVTFYGEGFGEGIQNNPLRMAGKRFRVFDIQVGTYWLPDYDVHSLSVPIGYRAVPFLGLIEGLPSTEKDMDKLFQSIGSGPISRVATEPVRAEGIVARTPEPMFDQYGRRLIWKLTYREFDKLRAIEALKKPTLEQVVEALT